MCNVCGCSGEENLPAEPEEQHSATFAAHVHEPIMQDHDRHADRNRQTFSDSGVLVVNLMSSPGAGKTSLIEATIRELGARFRIGVIEGDLETENDAARIRRLDVQAEQITTGIACHLDAHMVGHVLPRFDLEALDLLFIEDVGNLICPACFDLGQHANVVLLSVPEGIDKPEKYPVMFRAADLIVLSKIDYLPHAPEFTVAGATASAHRIGVRADTVALSARSGLGLDNWVAWLEQALTHGLADRRNRMNLST
jgi:hydrogenase nickel incorporation protein HypB